MEFLRETWETILDFLDRLSPAQKWTFGLAIGVVLMALGTLYGVLSKTSLVPLGIELSPSEQSAVMDYLDEQQVQYKLRDNRLYVPRKQSKKLVFDLAGEGVISTDKKLTKWLFQEDFDTKQKRDMKWNVTRERRMELVLTKMDSILSADVRVTPGEDPQTLRPGRPSKASVRLKLLPGKELSEENVKGIARVVSGSVEMLKPENVHIIDNEGDYYRVPDAEKSSQISAQLKEQKRQQEKNYRRKILEMFPWAAGDIRSVVTVHLNKNKKTIELTEQEGNPQQEKMNETEVNRTQGEPPGTEPNTDLEEGILQNGRARNPGAESGQGQGRIKRREQSSTSREKFVEKRRHEVKKITPGSISQVRATVVLPEEPLQRQVFGEVLSDEEQDQEENRKAIQEQLDQYRQIVQNIINVPGEDKSNVEMITASMKPPAPPQKPPLKDRLKKFASRNFDSILVGFLILIGLFVVYRVIKQAYPGGIQSEIEKMQEQLAAEEKRLEGVPTDAEEARARNLKEQVEEIVEKDASGAASLLDQWLKE